MCGIEHLGAEPRHLGLRISASASSAWSLLAVVGLVASFIPARRAMNRAAAGIKVRVAFSLVYNAFVSVNGLALAHKRRNGTRPCGNPRKNAGKTGSWAVETVLSAGVKSPRAIASSSRALKASAWTEARAPGTGISLAPVLSTPPQRPDLRRVLNGPIGP